jgi:hypothetical protein
MEENGQIGNYPFNRVMNQVITFPPHERPRLSGQVDMED